MSARGMTLMELIVVVAIVPIIMVAIADSVIFFYRSNTSALEEAYQVQSAQNGIGVMVRDLREAAYGQDGSYPLGTMASSSLTFYADVDRDTQVEKVRYQLSGTSLTRTVTEPAGSPVTYSGAVSTSTVSAYVRNFSDNVSVFRYYDSTGAEVTDPAKIGTVTSVTLDIVVDVTLLHLPGEFTLVSSATLRNLRPQ